MNRAAIIAAFLLPLLSACAATGRAPASGTLNDVVLEVLREYPVDGSHGYHWPKEGGWEGTTESLWYDGVKLTSGDPQKRCYCCGLTFEVFVKSLLRANGGSPVPGLTAADLHETRLRFFGDAKPQLDGTTDRRRLVQYAISSMKLGKAVTRLEEARAGDFVQFWRHSGSGHSVIFINWMWDEGKISGLTYWSTQGSTRGIGYRTEWIGPEGIKRDEIYVARADRPASAP